MRADHDHGLRLAHDVVRVVNELRMHPGVEGDERITVRIDADAEVAAAVETHRRTIADGVLAVRIELGPTGDGVPVPLNSSLATITGQRCDRAAARAWASCGRRSSASAPLPEAASTNSTTSAKPAVSAKRATAACCASMPRPERRCRSVETR
jgi:hypothetical protein